MNGQTWFTVTQAADYTGWSEQTLYAALRAGEMRGHQRGRGGHWRIHRDDLDAWVRGEIAPVTVPVVTRRRTRA